MGTCTEREQERNGTEQCGNERITVLNESRAFAKKYTNIIGFKKPLMAQLLLYI